MSNFVGENIKSKELQIVILAAGKGVRMRSELPKVLHECCGQSILERVLRAVCGLGPKRVILVLGFGEASVREKALMLKAAGVLGETELCFVSQLEQKGTGHAMQIASVQLASDCQEVLILPGDAPLLATEQLAELLNFQREQEAELVLGTCDHPLPTGFGRIKRDADTKITGIIEEKDCSAEEREIKEINSSIYAAKRDFLLNFLPLLSNDNAQAEYYLTDIVGLAVGRNIPVRALKFADYRLCLGANTKAELSYLERIRREQINNHLMDSGVSFEDPAATYIDEGVEVSAGCYLGAGTRLKGKTKLSRGVIVQGNALIRDCEIGEKTIIKFCCDLESATIGQNCEVGPFAHLRPGTRLHDEVRIGNFVEIKQAEIERGAKANHLTYLGDAFIGEQVNIGAGTITCNYDGANKYRTTVEEGCFIGSNSCLVAPVRVGAGAYVAAGSTITKDIPAGSLGIGRGKQSVVEGWVGKRKLKKKE